MGAFSTSPRGLHKRTSTARVQFLLTWVSWFRPHSSQSSFSHGPSGGVACEHGSRHHALSVAIWTLGTGPLSGPQQHHSAPSAALGTHALSLKPGPGEEGRGGLWLLPTLHEVASGRTDRTKCTQWVRPVSPEVITDGPPTSVCLKTSALEYAGRSRLRAGMRGS